MVLNHHLEEDQISWKTILCWLLLAFNAGCINAGGFLATGRFVTHVTGFATLFGQDLVEWRLDAALGILSVPIFFLLGSLVAGLMIDHRVFRNEKPRYDIVLGFSGLCLLLAAFDDQVFGFKEFGQDFHLKQNYILLVLLCFTSGLQNAAITSSSGRSVRTTHLTGLTTDLGLGIAHLLLLRKSEREFQIEKRANLLRIGSIISFVIGSAVGTAFFILFGYRGFLFPSFICFLSIQLANDQKWSWRKLITPLN